MKRVVGFVLLIIGVSFFSITNCQADGLYGAGKYGSCQYGTCSISIISNSATSLNITPTSTGKCTVQSDTVGVLTDNSNGYTLSLAASTTNTNLQSGSALIGASSATFASPAALNPNAWGYRVDGAGTFGSGPTTTTSNSNPNGTTFAGIKASNQTADTLVSTSVPASPTQNTTVWYGLCANTSINNGTYTTQVTYTAVAN